MLQVSDGPTNAHIRTPVDPALNELLDKIYDENEYKEEEVVQADEFTEDVVMAGDEQEDAVMVMLRERVESVKRIDIENMMYSFKRIEEVIAKGLQTTLLELRLSSCKIISQECH